VSISAIAASFPPLFTCLLGRASRALGGRVPAVSGGL
jgi:hypothetical protein